MTGSFADKLNPYVREKFKELWLSARPKDKRYITIFRSPFSTGEAKDLPQLLAILRQAIAALEAMLADGVTLDAAGRNAGDYACLVTTDPEVAKKYDMHDESEFMDGGKASSARQ